MTGLKRNVEEQQRKEIKHERFEEKIFRGTARLEYKLIRNERGKKNTRNS